MNDRISIAVGTVSSRVCSMCKKTVNCYGAILVYATVCFLDPV